MPPVSNSQLAKPGPGCCVDRRQKDFLVVENETAETNCLSNFHAFRNCRSYSRLGIIKYYLLKVELEVNEVIDILIIVVNRFDMSLDGHVLVATVGRSQSIPKSNGG
jgi:hypothetical protein